jgi:hypothetical protein
MTIPLFPRAFRDNPIVYTLYDSTRSLRNKDIEFA